jgi:Na+-transporting NADH:ubiquinone oxidoreductase subunit NqrB
MEPIHWMILVWLVVLPVAFYTAIKLPTPSERNNHDT